MQTTRYILGQDIALLAAKALAGGYRSSYYIAQELRPGRYALIAAGRRRLHTFVFLSNFFRRLCLDLQSM